MRKILIMFMILFSLNLINNKANASDLISVSPEIIKVGETDLGKTYTITITNASNEKIVLKAQEIRLIVENENEYKVDENEFSENVLEIFVDEFEVEPGESYDHKVRVKFISGDFTLVYPGISYTNVSGSDISISFEKNIPVIIQNRAGQYNMEIDLKLNHENITTDPNILVTGSIKNIGGKFYEAAILLNIYKNNEIIKEVDLTDQIKGLIFPQDTKGFEFSYLIEKTSWQDYGEYRIEVKLSNDINTSTKSASINFLFIPTQTAYLAGGVLIALIFIMFSVFFYKKKNNNISNA